jgi:glutamate receptor, ionotropic, invertebrate
MIINPKLEGNDRFSGYLMDIFKEIARRLDFQYEIEIVHDNNFGTDLGNGSWNGMVHQLMAGRADIALASFTITRARQRVIDFSTPYVHVGISILAHEPGKETGHLWSFFSPLSFDIWIYVLLAVGVCALSLYIIARFSPYEWINNLPNDPDKVYSDALHKSLTLTLISLIMTIKWR